MLDFLLKHQSKFSAAIFMGMLTLPLLGHALSGQDKAAAAENRILASFPGVDRLSADWPAYPAALNAWMEDRVGFRNDLIGLNFKLRDELDLERSGQAVKGDDGWYFNALDGALKMHQGLLPYGAGEGGDWLRASKRIQTAAEAGGAKFLVLLVPNKHEIYGEKLSAYPVRLKWPRRAQALAALAPDFGVNLIYPEAELLAAKAKWQLFYKTDSHWSGAGAFIGYQALIEGARAAGLSVPQIEADSQLTLSEQTKTGDLYGLLAITNGTAETVSELGLVAPLAFEQTPLPDFDWLSEKAFHMQTATSEGPSVLIYGDSFSRALLPYLRESFSEVTFVHHRRGQVPLSALETGAYDLVVLQMAERFLSEQLEPDLP